MLLQFSQFFLLYLPSALTPNPPASPSPSSCPWVVNTSSLSPPFPIPFFTSGILEWNEVDTGENRQKFGVATVGEEEIVQVP